MLSIRMDRKKYFFRFLDKISARIYIQLYLYAFHAPFHYRAPSFLKARMDIIRIIWTINFFFFLLILIFLWSKLYLISRKITDLISILRKCDELPEITPLDTGPSEQAP